MNHNRFSLLSMAGGFLLAGLIITTNITSKDAMDISKPHFLIAGLGSLFILISVYYFYRLFKFKGASEKVEDAK